MSKWYEHSDVYEVRSAVQQRLRLPAVKNGGNEPATDFWARVERAGLLIQALALYDQLAAQRAAQRQVWRETKEQFAQRVQREGRQAQAERLRAELLASGLSQRQAQVELVERLQPLDGSATRAWETPDPWEAGRLFRRKADQNGLLARARRYEDEDEDDEDQEVDEGLWRLECARRRRAERLALAAARRRAQALKAAAAE
jgi:hypothetical protein